MTDLSTTKADIADALYTKVDLPKEEVKQLVDYLFEMVRLELVWGRTVKLPGFGNFTVYNKRARVGRNPKTGQAIEITARKVVAFKPSTILRVKVASTA